MGFPGGSDNKESTRSRGDRGSISGSEDPLEKGMATHCSILGWKMPWTEEPGSYSPWDHKELDMTERLTHNNFHICE